MGAPGNGNPGTDNAYPDEQVAGQFFGPGRRNLKHEAAQDLDKNGSRHQKQHYRENILDYPFNKGGDF
jgi:hypothetical protein